MTSHTQESCELRWRSVVVVVRTGDLDRDRAVEHGGVARAEDVLLPEAVPVGWGQHAHRCRARLQQGVVTLRGDDKSAR